MKKTLAMLLVFVMLFSLCACNSSDNKTTDPSDSSQSTTNGTENTTGNTENPTDGTEGTQPPTDEPTTPPTDEPTTPPTQAPTEAPTTPPTQAPTEDPTTPPTTCSHSWKDATCTAPKTCSKCGATEGSATGHSWKDATCTAPKTCSKCGATEGSASGHSWKDATCTAPKTCSKCGATEGSAKGHSYSNGACSVCGTADPSFKQLTEGAWRYNNKIITFAKDGTWLGVRFESNLLTMDRFYAEIEEYKKSDGGYIPEVDSWYTLYEINGVRYACTGSYQWGGTYTVNGDTVLLIDEDMGNDEMGAVRIDGDTIKISETENSFGASNLSKGEYEWCTFKELGVPSENMN